MSSIDPAKTVTVSNLTTEKVASIRPSLIVDGYFVTATENELVMCSTAI